MAPLTRTRAEDIYERKDFADVDGDHQHMNENRRYEGRGVEGTLPPYRADDRHHISARA